MSTTNTENKIILVLHKFAIHNIIKKRVHVSVAIAQTVDLYNEIKNIVRS